MPATRVFFWVQHLLGIGHLKRTATLARAFRRTGMDVTIVSGGPAVPGIDIADSKLIQLPAVRAADKYFKVLVDENDAEIDCAFRAHRRDQLVDAFRHAARVRGAAGVAHNRAQSQRQQCAHDPADYV